MENLDRDSLECLFVEIIKLQHYRAQTLFDEIGIYHGQPPLLIVLSKEDGLSQKEIAAKLGVKPSTLTVMLKRMESGDLVAREQDPEDNRISRVYITEKGRVVCKEAQEKMSLLGEECFGNFTVDEQVVLRRLLMQMRDNLCNAINKK